MEENKIKNDNTIEELSEDELSNVTGGDNLRLHFFDTKEQVIFIFFYGDIVYVKENIFCNFFVLLDYRSLVNKDT